MSDGAKSTIRVLAIQVWRTRPGDYYPLAIGNMWRYRDDEDNQVIFEIVGKIQIQLRGGEKVDSYVLQKSSTNEELEGIRNFSYLGKQILSLLQLATIREMKYNRRRLNHSR